jgi:hypothetical protein
MYANFYLSRQNGTGFAINSRPEKIEIAFPVGAGINQLRFLQYQIRVVVEGDLRRVLYSNIFGLLQGKIMLAGRRKRNPKTLYGPAR